MKWQGREQSSNIEDRRAQGGGGLGGGGLGGGMGSNPFGRGGIQLPSGRSGTGLGGVLVIVIFIVIAMAFGINPLSILTGEDTSSSPLGNAQTMPPRSADEDQLKQFVGVVVKDTENFWGSYFQQHGGTYTDPKVVLFSGQTSSGCGTADAASGPFYCPDDQKVYIDLSFYQQLRNQFGAPGDFAQAYVVAHE